LNHSVWVETAAREINHRLERSNQHTPPATGRGSSSPTCQNPSKRSRK
jgi:hypothetical protein